MNGTRGFKSGRVFGMPSPSVILVIPTLWGFFFTEFGILRTRFLGGPGFLRFKLVQAQANLPHQIRRPARRVFGCRMHGDAITDFRINNLAYVFLIQVFELRGIELSLISLD